MNWVHEHVFWFLVAYAVVLGAALVGVVLL